MPGAACHAFVFASEQNGQPAVAIVWPFRCEISWRYRTEQAGRPMTLEEEIFNDESERAQRMGRGVQHGYWDGYLTGLMRAFFGSEAVSDHLDSALLAGIKGEDTAAGYRDGYHKLADCRSRLGGVEESAGSAIPAESTSTNPYAPISV